MKKVLFFGFLFILFLPFAQAQEEITLTTFYPSPSGVFQELTISNPNPSLFFTTNMSAGTGARIELSHQNQIDFTGVRRMNTCVLVNYPVPGVCPQCYFTGEYEAPPTGQILCCRVDNPPAGFCSN